MTPERWQDVETLFEAAVALPPKERAALLTARCNGDSSLRTDVEALLASDSAGDDGVEETASSVAAAWMAETDGHDLLGKTIGRYEVLAPLAAGGMGEVFLAHDKMLDRKVALKFLRRQFTQDRDRLRRFEQEARAASALNHPNIITIYEIGEIDGTRFMATEYVEGETLRELIDGARRDVAEILEIGCQSASALAAAHGAGIVHRDIKPANIMLRRDGYIKVLDFGLAKLTSARAHLDVTEPGRVMGTINYMSPEQAMGQPLDHRTDIFSLGVVLYELATGRRLFEGGSEAAVYDSILHKEAPPLREFAPATPLALDQVFRRALEKDPARRYQSAADLRNDLKQLAQGTGKTEAARVAARRRQSRAFRTSAAVALIVAILAAVAFLARQTVSVPNETLRKSIAVLPFANLSRDDENADFADGMQDQILTDLAKIAQLKVIGSTSVMHYRPEARRDLREIGRELRAGYLLEGSVQRVGERVRVNARLMDVTSDGPLWAESYDRLLADVFDIQKEIATAIATKLQARLSPAQLAEISRKPTTDLHAFELYVRGKKLLELAYSTNELQEENARAAIDALSGATQRDPAFLLAWTELARAQDLPYWTGLERTPARLALGQAAVDMASKLAPASGEAQLARAEHLYVQRNYDAALRDLTAARASMPNNVHLIVLGAFIQRRQSHWERSTEELETAMELDPRNPSTLQELAINYLSIGRRAEGAAALDRVIELAPDRLGVRLARACHEIYDHADTQPLEQLIETTLQHDPSSASSLVRSQIALAFYKRDTDALTKALAALGDDGWYGDDTEKFSRQFGEGMLARMKGDDAAARHWFTAARAKQQHIVDAQADYAPAVSMLGLIDAALGRKEEAVAEGRRAVELLPVEKDAIVAPSMTGHLAIIAACVGEKDIALELLQRHSIPPACVYGDLKLHPFWDPLRNDPRFQEILAALAPHE